MQVELSGWLIGWRVDPIEVSTGKSYREFVPGKQRELQFMLEDGTEHYFAWPKELKHITDDLRIKVTVEFLES